jgi:type II secretory pathway pseudopilin PulG
MSFKNSLACGAAISLALLATSPAFAQQSQINAQMQALQQQIQQLQQQLQAVQTQVNTQQTQVQQVQQQQSATAAKPGGNVMTFGNNNGVKVTLGGFIEAASIYRSRDEFSDVGSSFSTIPFKDVATSHSSEFRETARQSRISILAQNQYDQDTKFAAYYEMDFLGNSTTSNSGESNSYVMRIRHLYLTVDKLDYGLHFLGGQTWSMVVPFKTGMDPRSEVIPLTIDAQYVPGFNWRRDPQIRLVDDINPMIHLGLSLESPQASFGGTTKGVVNGIGNGSGGGTLNPVDTGGCVIASPVSTTSGALNTTCSPQTYSMDVAPDIVAKVAFDPGFGHYELYGLGRAFQSRAAGITGVTPPAGPDNHIVWGGGVGGSAQVPVIPGWVDAQASGLGGKGIGTYGSSQLPDVTTDQFGNVHAINEYSALAGLIGHVMPGLDTYVYGGYERAMAEQFAGTAGYGLYNLKNGGCDMDQELNAFGAPAAGGAPVSCSAVNKDVWQITGGLWDKLWDGPGGSVRVGVSYSFTRRDTFAGNGGFSAASGAGPAPYATDNIIMTSFRYYPF